MTPMTHNEIQAAIQARDLRALAGHAASSALASARENGAKPGDDEREAAERLDDRIRIFDICGCQPLECLSDSDLHLVARLAVAIIEGLLDPTLAEEEAARIQIEALKHGGETLGIEKALARKLIAESGGTLTWGVAGETWATLIRGTPGVSYPLL